MTVMCLRYNGEVEETALSLDEAGSLLGQYEPNDPKAGLHLFLSEPNDLKEQND